MCLKNIHSQTTKTFETKHEWNVPCVDQISKFKTRPYLTNVKNTFLSNVNLRWQPPQDKV